MRHASVGLALAAACLAAALLGLPAGARAPVPAAIAPGQSGPGQSGPGQSGPGQSGPGQSGVELRQGIFLVASPTLTDPNFVRTVVLLVEYGPGGAMGLIVNRRMERTLADLLPEMDALHGRRDPVYFGGPVGGDRIVLLLQAPVPPPAARHVVGSLYVTASEASLRRLLEDDSGARFHAFAGYSGWAPGQLDDELARGGWRLAEADEQVIFDRDPEEIWPELIRRTEGLWVRASGSREGRGRCGRESEP